LRQPSDAPEGPCTLYSVGYRGAAGVVTNETQESPVGTPEIMEIKSSGTVFKVSQSGSMPVAVPVFLAGEGEMQLMDIMVKYTQAVQGSWGKAGKSELLLSPDTV
jgi:hypothetical protein